jgi:hypothetical protein
MKIESEGTESLATCNLSFLERCLPLQMKQLSLSNLSELVS